jgi:alpha-1,2-mannosyltransferase
MTGASERQGRRVSTDRFTFWLAGIFLLCGLAVNVSLASFSPPGYAETTLDHTLGVLQGRSGDDSWGPMALALEYLEEVGTKPLYSALFFDIGIKYQYPPSALFALEGLMQFGPERVRIQDGITFENGPPINDFLGWACIAIITVAVWLILEISLRQQHPSNNWNRWIIFRFLLCGAFTLTFYPVVKAFTLGQIQLWVDALIALAVLAWVSGHRWMFGLLVGIAALIKPHMALLLVWASMAGGWASVASGAVVIAFGLSASILAYGFENHIDYLKVLSFLGERGEAFYPNQSVNGLLNRSMSLYSPEEFRNISAGEGPFPPYSSLVSWGTLLSSAAMLLAAMAFTLKSRDRTATLCVMLAAVTMASPVAWEHHYGVLLPAFAILAPRVVSSQPAILALVAAYLLLATYLDSAKLLASTMINFLQTYMLVGGLIVCLISFWAAARDRWAGEV